MGRKRSTWEDTGKDCPYCGGAILQRIDLDEHEQVVLTLYECDTCAAQWDGSWHLLRPGRRSGRTRNEERGEPTTYWQADDGSISTWVWIALFVVTALFLRFGGAVFLRLAIPFVVVSTLAFLIYRLGRDQEWW